MINFQINTEYLTFPTPSPHHRLDVWMNCRVYLEQIIATVTTIKCFETETYSNRNSILKESVGAAWDITGFEIRGKNI